MCLKSESFKILCVITFLTVGFLLFSSFQVGKSNSLPAYCGEYSGFGEKAGLGYNEPGACLDADFLAPNCCLASVSAWAGFGAGRTKDRLRTIATMKRTMFPCLLRL